jgi:hypothetical protein
LLASVFIGVVSCGGEDAPDGPLPARDPLKQPIATATLAPTGADPVSATATFAETQSGVDLTLVMRNCSGTAEKPVRILAARSCDGVSAASATWGDERGSGILGILCTSGTSGEGLVRYARRAALRDHWTVGDGSAHDVVGRAIAIFDPATQVPLACGVIERGEDRTLVALPPENEAPSTEARAQLAGLCIAKLTAGATSGACADASAITACAAEHCQLGACLEKCREHTACLDASPDRCNSACVPSSECADCQAGATSCSIAFCAGHMLCAAVPQPDGPCSHLLACCTLQGQGAANCLEVTRLITSVGGEASCVSALADWDVVSHTHVPCDTEAAWYAGAMPGPPGKPLEGVPCVTQADCADGVCVGSVRAPTFSSPGRCQPRAATTRLGDRVVGTACTSDATCGGGRCAVKTTLLTDFPGGYCSGRCYEDATCGEGGVCLLPLGSSDPGHCFQACGSDADCPRDHYRCTPLGDGVRVVRACYPREDDLPAGVAGRACQADADCANALCKSGITLSTLPPEQIVPAPGGYCSGPCLFDEDCGAGAQCISGGVSGGQCMSNCNDQTPCRAGYLCVEHMRDPDSEAKVCTPDWES